MVVVVVFDTAVNVTTIGCMATIDDDDDLATVRPVCHITAGEVVIVVAAAAVIVFGVATVRCQRCCCC